ncbi:MAG: acyl--CoA ligase [Actinobacteria bacterium]|nr:acyl--CoA ligase [Actinomycetota bacterium]
MTIYETIVTLREEVESLSIGQVLERSAALRGEKVALITEEGETVTYGQLNEETDALAAALQSLGIQKGDRVGIDLLNDPEIVISFFALAKLGAIAAWINPGYGVEEFSFSLKNSGAKALIMLDKHKGSNYLDLLEKVRPQIPELKEVLIVGEEIREHRSLRQLIEEYRGKEFQKADIDPRKDLVLFYNTGGTTGVPKAAMHTHYTAVMRATVMIPVLNATSDDVTLGNMPMFHTFGCAMGIIFPIATMGAVAIMREYNADKAMEIINKYKVTIEHCAPTHVILQAKSPNVHKHGVSSLRTGLAAGFTWPPEVFMRAKTKLGLDLVSAWGMSEIGGTGLSRTSAEGEDLRNTSIGKPQEGEARVVEPGTGKEVPRGEVGELVFRGPIMQGYWNNPEETRKAFDEEGWLHTGDLVSMDDNGYIYMEGRTKEQINRGGLKITPKEVEDILITHPKVKEICVISTKNPVLGESICVCVVPMDMENKPSLKELREYLEGKIAKYKLPDELSIFENFPRLAGGIKYKKFGNGSIQELATADDSRERWHIAKKA